MMSPFEYLLLLAAVILGLALSDLAVSTHRLVSAGARVKWDWLSPLAAILAFERIVTQWWTWYGADRIAKGMTFGMFIGVLASALLLFLMAAASLPDEVHGPIVDLRAYYQKIHRRYWLLFAAQWLVMNAVTAWAQVQIGGARLDLASPLYLIVVAAALLAFIRNRLCQTAGLAGFIALYSVVYFGRALG